MARIVRIALVAALLGLPAGVQAQDRDATLADIRQELSVLFVEMQNLRRELSTSGGAPELVPGGSLLDRIDAIEAEIARLNALTERLEFRIDRVVTDGTNRIGDLEFRLVELEGGDIGALGQTPTLGGEEMAPSRPVGELPQPDTAAVPELAASERADFERAEAALQAGDYEAAAEQFARFAEAYPGGPLSTDAHLLRGEAHAGLGDLSRSARAYLDAFTGAPDGPRAPEALLRLGRALHDLGQVNEACVMFDELTMRFPSAEVLPEALAAMRELGCN